MPSSLSPSDDRVEVDAGTRSGDRLDKDHTSLKDQAQILLTALRNVIIPVVEMALPNKRDLLHQTPIGPEAEDFLVALEKYISSIVRDQAQSDGETGVKRTVNLEETSPKTQKDIPTQGLNQQVSSTSRSHPTLPANLEEGMLVIPRRWYRGSYRSLDEQQEFILDKALTVLRTHVFNIMPIRLLCFAKHGSNLDITLLDRTGIYAHLMSKLRARVNSQLLQGSAVTSNDALSWVSKIAKYTILSHTWLRSAPGEVTFGDWFHSAFNLTHPGYRKLVNFCRIAAEEHDVTLGWMDTVCINKESSAELDESIRSMYKWYNNARTCIVYLAETTSFSNMAKDPWFTRGWTLQELLAPRYIAFYGAEWTTLGNNLFNDKEDRDIQNQITLATTITPTELISPLPMITISRKMQWAANREVTRGEDAAYSLMGIFQVNMSIAYGEGTHLAFTRLVKEILSSANEDILDAFNWAGDYDTDISVLIPSSPQAYLKRSAFIFGRTSLIEPITLTHLGLRIPVVVLPAVAGSSIQPYTPIGDYYTNINIEPISSEYANFPHAYNILDNSFLASPAPHTNTPPRLAFVVLNCGGLTERKILLMENCFAVAILYSADADTTVSLGYKGKIPTKDPVTFKLKNKRRTPPDGWNYDQITRSELANHGMQFLTMYL